MSTNFGEALSEFLKTNGLTQQEVADRTGIAQPVIGRLLKAVQPELPTISKISDGLDIEIQIDRGGQIFITPRNRPADIEIQAHTGDMDPNHVHFDMYDKVQHKNICTVRFTYKPGQIEPDSFALTRNDGIPGYVSNQGLLRWAQAAATEVRTEYLRTS